MTGQEISKVLKVIEFQYLMEGDRTGADLAHFLHGIATRWNPINPKPNIMPYVREWFKDKKHLWEELDEED